MIEVIKYFQSKGLRNILLTTDNGREAYERLGLVECETLEYQVIDSYKGEQTYPMILSYITRTVLANKLVKGLTIGKNDILFCHSDFFPNTIPFYSLTRRHRFGGLFCLFHMLAPSPLKGYEGHFTDKFQVPKINVIHYNLNQQLYYRLIPKIATILTNNHYYSQILSKKCPENRIYVLKRFAGADEHGVVGLKKVYDLVWVGRFHPQKGLMEVPAIVEIIKRKIPNVKAVIIGGGNQELEKQLLEVINRKDLANNIELKGFVMGKEKYRYMGQSKIFLMSSFYESFGIVSLEALKNGLPVIAYDMPVYTTFTRGMIKVPMLDRAAAAKKIIELLENPQFYKRAAKEAYEFGKDFSWQRTGEEVYQLL